MIDDLPPWPKPMLAAIPAPGPDGLRRVLDDEHLAVFRPAGSTLVVGFEEGRHLMAGGRTLAHRMEEREGWSSLSIVNRARSFFRGAALAAYFDGLTDEGFFDGFDRVLFVGADEEAGFAACAYSVAAPGATVLAVHPVATLERSRTAWERRFRRERAADWGARYAYAPAMVDAAARAYVLSDPTALFPEVHASLFQGPHVTHLHAPHAGADLNELLRDLDLFAPMAVAAAEGTLGAASFGALWRARRESPLYLAKLLGALDPAKRPDLTARACRWMLARDAESRPAQRALKVAEAARAERKQQVRIAGE
ncbi:phosphoadenosine phosphosulfate reductase [Jannaschia sp. Os4]|uniref:phosphoadenosine phosphosulfate reductase n=1 Tax=Jannaschia sp. Os4 TaxID=2807617 RepID=UPI00193A8874|nr:phosphoadenosine phosphosulfate reductase [Jannaschia sp. Os4]MBM2576935.1 phosphoadenosine phosphosulfate reductase [Jannaschia sp. Os4]